MSHLPASAAGIFTPALFDFLRELKRHNDREWFHANRERYAADVEGPMLRFIRDLAPGLASISPAFIVDPRRAGGSMYRIHRDTRFSPDKSPYKHHLAATFRHTDRRRVSSVPGFYLHLEPGDSMAGGGIYHPDPASLTRIRTAMVEQPKDWAAVKKTGIAIEGVSLIRAPAGFDASHRFIDDLRRKDLYALTPFSEEAVCSPTFLERYLESCRNVAPLVSFITRALGLRWWWAKRGVTLEGDP